MSKLGQVVGSIENYNKFVLDQVKRARTDRQFGRELLGRWNDTKAKIPVTRTPTGVPLPRLALPEIDDPGEIARYLFAEGLPGERSEEHTSELQSRFDLVCRLLLEKKK